MGFTLLYQELSVINHEHSVVVPPVHKVVGALAEIFMAVSHSSRG